MSLPSPDPNPNQKEPIPWLTIAYYVIGAAFVVGAAAGPSGDRVRLFIVGCLWLGGGYLANRLISRQP